MSIWRSRVARFFLFSHFSHPETLIRLACCIGACPERGGFGRSRTLRAQRERLLPRCNQKERSGCRLSLFRGELCRFRHLRLGHWLSTEESSARDKRRGRWPTDQSFIYFSKSRAWIKIVLSYSRLIITSSDQKNIRFNTRSSEIEWPKKSVSSVTWSSAVEIVWYRMSSQFQQAIEWAITHNRLSSSHQKEFISPMHDCLLLKSCVTEWSVRVTVSETRSFAVEIEWSKRVSRIDTRSSAVIIIRPKKVSGFLILWQNRLLLGSWSHDLLLINNDTCVTYHCPWLRFSPSFDNSVTFKWPYYNNPINTRHPVPSLPLWAQEPPLALAAPGVAAALRTMLLWSCATSKRRTWRLSGGRRRRPWAGSSCPCSTADCCRSTRTIGSSPWSLRVPSRPRSTSNTWPYSGNMRCWPR